MALSLDEEKVKAGGEGTKAKAEKASKGSVKMTKEEKIAKLVEKKKQIEAKVKQLQARDTDKERKTDTRRKAIIGGWVISMLEKDSELKAKIEGGLKATLVGKKEKDKELFPFLNLN